VEVCFWRFSEEQPIETGIAAMPREPDFGKPTSFHIRGEKPGIVAFGMAPNFAGCLSLRLVPGDLGKLGLKLRNRRLRRGKEPHVDVRFLSQARLGSKPWLDAGSIGCCAICPKARPGPQRQVAPSFFSNTEPLGSQSDEVHTTKPCLERAECAPQALAGLISSRADTVPTQRLLSKKSAAKMLITY
jgi:hypothetical protein